MSGFGEGRERLGGDQPVRKLFGDHFRRKREGCDNLRCAGMYAGAHIVGAGREDPGGFFTTVRSHRLRGEGDLKHLGFSRGKLFRLRVAAQLLIRLLKRTVRGGYIDLHHFASPERTGVGDPDGDGHILFVCRNVRAGHVKSGVGEAVAERILRGNVEGIEITVPDVDAFRVIFVVQVAVAVAERVRRRIIGVVHAPGGGQVAARVRLAGQRVRQGVAAVVAGLAHQKDGVDAVDRLQGFHVDDGAHV